MKPLIADRILELRGYLYDNLIGQKRNQLFVHGQPFWTLPQDIVSSIVRLGNELASADEKRLSELFAIAEGNITLAQTTNLLTEEKTSIALNMLYQIKQTVR
ncbi:MAG: hypothetical protein NVS1B7_2480 [Candidatus Saccharimonadales bacterium]